MPGGADNNSRTEEKSEASGAGRAGQRPQVPRSQLRGSWEVATGPWGAGRVEGAEERLEQV